MHLFRRLLTSWTFRVKSSSPVHLECSNKTANKPSNKSIDYSSSTVSGGHLNRELSQNVYLWAPQCRTNCGYFKSSHVHLFVYLISWPGGDFRNTSNLHIAFCIFSQLQKTQTGIQQVTNHLIVNLKRTHTPINTCTMSQKHIMHTHSITQFYMHTQRHASTVQ